MPVDYGTVALTVSAAVLSGFGTALVGHLKEAKQERIRQYERKQDMLKMEIKDLKIQLYQLERDLTEWKDKYYSAIQELIEVKAELEEALLKITLINSDMED